MFALVYLGDSPCVSVNSSRCAHWWGIQHKDNDNLKKQLLGGHCKTVTDKVVSFCHFYFFIQSVGNSRGVSVIELHYSTNRVTCYWKLHSSLTTFKKGRNDTLSKWSCDQDCLDLAQRCFDSEKIDGITLHAQFNKKPFYFSASSIAKFAVGVSREQPNAGLVVTRFK